MHRQPKRQCAGKNRAIVVIGYALIALLLCFAGGMAYRLYFEKPSLSSIELTERFFAAFEQADHEAMKPYCTKQFAQSAFHDGDVCGIVRAGLIDHGGVIAADDHIVRVRVTAEVERTEELGQGMQEETFYVVFSDASQTAWLIDGFAMDK